MGGGPLVQLHQLIELRAAQASRAAVDELLQAPPLGVVRGYEGVDVHRRTHYSQAEISTGGHVPIELVTGEAVALDIRVAGGGGETRGERREKKKGRRRG